MPGKAEYVMVVLFEDEIRLATKAVAAFYARPKDASDEVIERLLSNVLRRALP